jgi:diacylglycerol kinase (ATP)
MNIDAGDAALRAAKGEVSPRRILAVFNPAAGRNRRARFDEVVAALRIMGAHVTVATTAATGHAEVIARDAGSDFDVIAAAGGDGTINEVVNGLVGKTTALGILPLGTANVLADEISMPRSIDGLARTLAHGPVREIYVGRANGRRFVMMSGAGFDADVVGAVTPGLKKALGPLAYVWQAGVQAFRTRRAACEVLIDGERHAAASVVACNGRRYGGPFIAAPGASLTDGCLHVILMRGNGWFDIARYGAALVLGRISKLHDVRVIEARDIVVRGTDGRAVQADGDIVARLPVHITVDPEPVKLVFPA